jgi:HlyD family secretion protein
MDRRVQAAKSTGARSRQAVQVAAAQVAEAVSRAKLAAVNRDRDRGLYEKGIISKQALDSSTSEAERAEAALAGTRANALAVKDDVQRVDAESQGLGSLRESLRLVSPVDGVIVSREAEPGSTVAAGQAVLRLVVPDSLWVRARVDQSRAKGVQVGQVASIVLRSSPETPIPGRVARIEMQSDAVTEERVVNVTFDSPPAQLYLGELAEVTIRLPGETDALIVPSAAVAREGSQAGVWQMVDGRARFKPVTRGSLGQPGVTQILSGLGDGDSVIVYSSAQLKIGARVREQRVEPL